MTPAEVIVDNEHMVRKRLHPIKPKSHKWKYEVGDRVRIAKQKHPLRKGYLGDWSHEIFEISSAHRSRHVRTRRFGGRKYKR